MGCAIIYEKNLHKPDPLADQIYSNNVSFDFVRIKLHKNMFEQHGFKTMCFFYDTHVYSLYV